MAPSSHKASARCLQHLTTFQLTGCEEAPQKLGDDVMMTGIPFFLGGFGDYKGKTIMENYVWVHGLIWEAQQIY